MRECEYVDLPGGSRVCYAEYGDPGGRPLLFFHGWPSSRRQGRLCHGPAAAMGWRVIAPDRPGIGGTPFAPGRRLADAVPWATSLLDALGIGGPVALLGVSGGAPYVYALLHGMADRAGPAAVVCGAVPLAEIPDHSDLLPLYRLMLGLKGRAPRLLAAGLGAGAKLASWPLGGRALGLCAAVLPEPDRRAMEDPTMRTCIGGSFQESMRQGAGAVIADAEIYLEEWEFRLEDVGRPVALWHGELDGNIPVRMAKEVASRLPACRAHWCATDGHYSLPARRLGEVLEGLRVAGGVAV